ncbi:MAG: AMP-binding protein, partial [Dethiobacteria bacterium]|nr:AMP-binding protein [Dethiobacteria bacterium]
MSYADKPWLDSYMMGPYKLDRTLEPYPEVPLFSALDNAAEKYPRQTAILFLERELKYKELKEQVDRLAAGLAGMGVNKSDRVCIYLPNCPEFIIAEWAILKCGGVVVPVSILRTETGLQHEVESSGSRVIFCRKDKLEQVLDLKEKGLVEQVVVSVENGYDLEFAKGSLPLGFHDFRKILRENDPVAPPVEINPREDLAILAFTGGATGVTKGVMLTHFNRYSNLRQGLPWIMKPMIKGIAGKASVFLPVPLFHAYGQYIAQSAIYLGLRIILMPDPRDSEAMVEQIRKHRPLMITAVPTQLM